MKYEYTVLSEDVLDFEAALNRYADAGWEPVGGLSELLVHDEIVYYAVLLRRAAPPPEGEPGGKAEPEQPESRLPDSASPVPPSLLFACPMCRPDRIMEPKHLHWHRRKAAWVCCICWAGIERDTPERRGVSLEAFLGSVVRAGRIDSEDLRFRLERIRNVAEGAL